MPVFGWASVANRQRAIFQTHSSSTSPSLAIGGWIGTEVDVSNRLRTLAPKGLAPPTFGYPTVPGLQKIWATLGETSAFGDAGSTNRSLFKQVILGDDAFLSWAPGALEIQNFNRPVGASGWVNTEWGNNDPMVYFPRKIFPHSEASDRWGSAMISDRIRPVLLAGWESFTCETDSDWPNKMMTLRENPRARPPGCDSAQMGLALSRLAIQRISPYMIPPRTLCGRGLHVFNGI